MTQPERATIRALYKALWAKPLISFPAFGERMEAPQQLPGVYIIYDEWGQVFYVGQTAFGLAHRLGAHMRGRRNKRRRRLGGFSYLVVTSASLRLLLEDYATARLHPRHLGGGWEGIG